MNVSVEFEGGAELVAALGQLSARVSKRIQREALTDAGEKLARLMARKAPHAPGKPDLRDTMTVSNARGTDGQETAIAVGPSKAGFYGSFQEFGTAHHAAQPFMRPAFDESAQATLTLLSQAMWTALAGRGVSRSVTQASPVEHLGRAA